MTEQWVGDSEVQQRWRTWWRVIFASFLLAALGIGLYQSFRPADFDEPPRFAEEQEVTGANGVDEEEGDGDGGGDNEGEEADPADDGEEAEDEGLTDDEREALIDAARDPAETSVQVLDAGSGSSAANDAAEVLRDLGYDVVAVNSARADYDVTTVLFTAGNEDEAAALNARDDRFAETAPNERLSEDVDLHVVVGPDWS